MLENPIRLTPKMRTDGTASVELALIVSIHGSLLQSLSDDTTAFGLEVLDVLQLAWSEPVRILHLNMDVGLDKLFDLVGHQTGGIVQLLPGLEFVLFQDHVLDDHRSDGSVSHTMARI